MNNALDDIKKNFQPYRLTKKKNITIIESTKGSYVIKEKENNHIAEAYAYLKSRNFDCFPNILEELRSDINIFEYIEEIPTPREQKALDLMEIVASLHNKTTYYKEITPDKYKEIKEVCKSSVKVANMSDEEIIEYIDTEEPFDKAGSYAIQSSFCKYIEKIDGNYMSIIGLPINRVYKILKENEII